MMSIPLVEMMRSSRSPQEPAEVFSFSAESTLAPKATDSRASVQGQRALCLFSSLVFYFYFLNLFINLFKKLFYFYFF